MNWLPVLAHGLLVELIGPTLSRLTTQFRSKKEHIFAPAYIGAVIWFWFHTKPKPPS